MISQDPKTSCRILYRISTRVAPVKTIQGGLVSVDTKYSISSIFNLGIPKNTSNIQKQHQ